VPAASGRRLYEHVSDVLGERIRSGEYRIGGRLPSERELAQSLTVSRPTVREAILSLELEGLVEVRLGSGVYVRRTTPSQPAGVPDVGPFELLEARRIIESEVCACAALRVTAAHLERLGDLITEMERQNETDVLLSERADRQFHEAIAEATENTALMAAVTALWDARARSPLIQRLSVKAHAAGVKPGVSEHRSILAALSSKDPHQARNAMSAHLARVMDQLLEATEVETIEQARQQAEARRRKFDIRPALEI
jgi:DNA-binding FadR family transcriptional regulator